MAAPLRAVADDAATRPGQELQRTYEPDEERVRAFVALFMAAATDEEDAA